MFIAYQDQVPDSLVHELGNPSLARWFWEEYKKRQYAELAAALKDQEKVSKENYHGQHRPHDLLGECTFRIARSMRNWIGRRFGWDLAVNNEFCKEIIRNNQGVLGIKHTYDLNFVPTQEKRTILVKTRDLDKPPV